MNGVTKRRLIVLGLYALTLGAVGMVPIAARAGQVGDSPAGVRAPARTGRSAIYGGGAFYSGGQAVMDTLRSSGFTTVILWSIHVHSNGDLYYNDTLVVANGQYVGDSGWAGRLRTLKQAPTSVNRIEVSVGSAGVDDWGTIGSLIRSQGTGCGTILYRNFRALLTVTGADAINDDDEASYDVGTTTTFARMAQSIGYRSFTLAPYAHQSFWASVRSDLSASVDRVYLQDYAGGTGNDPAAWSAALGMTVDPGLWSKHGSGCTEGDSPASVQSTMTDWHNSAGIVGGFIWLFDDIQQCSSQGTVADYARAIRKAVTRAAAP
jgi:hypothetical protein